MKKNDKNTLRNKTTVERLSIVESAQKELSVLRMQFAVGKVKNVKLMKAIRKKIAVAKTMNQEAKV